MQTLNTYINKSAIDLRSKASKKASKSYEEKEKEKSVKELQGIENYAMVNIFFTSYGGALWKSQLSGIDYEAEGRRKLWESALSEFSSGQVEQALNAINTGNTDIKGIPAPGEFSRLCRRFKPAYYGPEFIDKQKVKELPSPPVNKKAARAELSKCWKLLGYKGETK